MLLAWAGPAAAQAGHPLDALTGAEVAKAVAILKAAGHADATSRFPTITLLEPAKAQVLAWAPGDPVGRAAFVVMRHTRATYEAEIDLTAERVSRIEAVAGQPSIIIDEWLTAQDLTMADPRWRAAMAKRGITDFAQVTCSPLSPGRFAGESFGDRRILKVPCYDNRPAGTHLYGRPIAGVFSVVDVEAGEVLDVVDLGVVELPDQPEPARWQREPLKPVLHSAPQGANYEISGAVEVAWQNWSFHMRMDKRVGPIISLVRYDDDGRKRLVAYQISLSEMFVPYMDPGADWSYRTYLDSGEFGAGVQMSTLMSGSDCPETAAFVSTLVPNDKGETFPVRRAVCVFERNTGDPLWRHGSPARPTQLTRPEIELVVRSIPTIGNYDYVIDTVFTQAGEIEFRVGAAGIIAVRSVETGKLTDPTAARDTAYGELVAPGTVAIYHDHFFSFRLDLDIDGQKNTLIQDAVVPQRLPNDNPRRSIWTVERGRVVEEGSIGGGPAAWRVSNPNIAGALGHNPSYQIVPGHQDLSVLARDDDAQARALFATRELWVTRHHPRELYAAGDYPHLSAGGAGLPAYAGDGEAVDNQDIVVWYTVGFHHITRTEDWPIMPVQWHGFRVRPFNFFAENPVYDLPAGYAQPEAPALRATIPTEGGGAPPSP
jgi:primary-amine oxidase